jgi:sulfotransferase family protein
MRARVPFARARRFDLCCCGLSKTGTHSMAGLFASYRSEHHPDAPTRLELAMRYLKGEIGAAVAQETLARRDRLLGLEMESSSLAGALIEPLVAACPEKKFILTIRDVYSWCDSWLDHNINEPPAPSSLFGAFDLVRLRVRDFPPTKHDAPLVARGFPSLACYFQLWASHNARVLDAVPASRLLVVKTAEIRDRIPDVARWAGVPPETLRADRSWLFAAPKKHGLLGALDASYVRDTAHRHCGALMERYFAG